MLIDFSDIEEKPLEHFKGGEGTFFARMFTDPKVKIMRGRLEHGASIGLHTHEGNSEIVFILEGKGKMLCDGRYEELIEKNGFFAELVARQRLDSADMPHN